MHDSAIKAGMKIIMVLASISEFLFTLNDTWQEKKHSTTNNNGMCSLNELNEGHDDSKITLKTITSQRKGFKVHLQSASYQDLLQGIRPPSMETPKNPGHAIDNKQ